jgi:RsiW-degrading membrane proteinase PrsW (M82 family)
MPSPLLLEIMKPTNIAIITFILGTVVGFLAIAVGYIAYADSANYFDREGATGMAVMFFYAPVGGILVGIISAVATFKILKRRTP